MEALHPPCSLEAKIVRRASQANQAEISDRIGCSWRVHRERVQVGESVTSDNCSDAIIKGGRDCNSPPRRFPRREKGALVMSDNLSPQSRRRAMAAVKSTGTTPERVVCAALKRLRYRFRENDPQLPGKPDFVLRRKRIAIFVHGCYWHSHHCTRGARMPKTNVAYWRRKISGNVARDKMRISELRRNQWRVLVIWECQTRRQNLETWLARRIARFTDL